MPSYFEHNGLRFHYHTVGEGLPFFFQHGLGADVAQPFWLFKPPTGVRLIALDCRFHGRTGPVGEESQISIGTFADDLLALMDYLKIERAVVGGISMGAAIALNFALRFPDRVRALVLHRPAWLAEPNQKNVAIFSYVAKLIRDYHPLAAADELRSSKLYAEILAESTDSANSLVMQLSNPRAKNAVGPLERIPLDAPNHDRAEWRQIKVPTLVLANRQDPIHPFEFGEILAREIPGAEFHEITSKSASFERYQEDSQKFIAEFLETNFSPSKNSIAIAPKP